jgi:hypothetical protein
MAPMHAQSPRKRTWLESGLLALWSLLTGCYAMDSATSACQRTPAYCTAAVGEETVVPGVRGGAEVASLSGVYRLLTPDTRARVEQQLVACAESADAQVNRLHFAGLKPTRQQCQEVLSSKDPCGRMVTRAMQLGSEKHYLALQCAQEKLESLVPGRFRLEPRYRYDTQQHRPQHIPEQEARALLRQGCSEHLRGTLRPDVVLHSGSPLEVQAVYDFKFPCPPSNRPVWSPQDGENIHPPEHQGTAYAKALNAEAAIVSPERGITEKISP